MQPQVQLISPNGTNVKRVLFLVASDWYFCCHRLPLAKRVVAEGYEVHVVTPIGRFRKEIEGAGLRYTPLPFDRQGLNPAADLATIAKLTRLYSDIRPGVVHHVALKPILYGSIAARLAGVPAVVNAMPGMGYVFLSKQLLSRAIRPAVITAFRTLLNRRNSRVILQNPDDVEAWVTRGVRRDRVVLIRGAGVDIAQFAVTPGARRDARHPSPARLLYDKGVQEFVDAAQSIRRKHPRVRFALVGEGDPGNPSSVPAGATPRSGPETALKGLLWVARRHGERKPARRDQHRVPSVVWRRSFPKALLEAAACGRAIVTTDVPGCREIVTDGDNGFLVPARDAGALARALERLIVDPALRRTMGERGRRARVVTEFSADAVATATLKGVRREQLGEQQQVLIHVDRHGRIGIRRPQCAGCARCERIVASRLGATHALARLLEGATEVVHAASVVHRTVNTGGRITNASMSKGTRALIEASRVAGVKQFVFVSSIKVHGESPAWHHRREHAGGSGASTTRGPKREAEKIVLAARDLNPIVLRLCHWSTGAAS